MPDRLKKLQSWLTDCYPHVAFQLTPMAGDASFRRYFRICFADPRPDLVAMDAPPSHENCQPFVDIAHYFADHGLHTPTIEAQDLSQGFLLLEDFGDQLFANVCQGVHADHYYQQAIDTLVTLQTMPPDPLPAFDYALMREQLNNCQYWFLEKWLGLSLSPAEQQMLDNCFDRLCSRITKQPQVSTHMDYHSRNLMILPNDELGLLDFQDATHGPTSYDLGSLLADAYVDLPNEQVQRWLNYYFEHPLRPDFAPAFTRTAFKCWYDWTMLQRQLKILFIFTRKQLRDNDSAYLRYLPLVLKRTHAVLSTYDEFADCLAFFDSNVFSRNQEQQA